MMMVKWLIAVLSFSLLSFVLTQPHIDVPINSHDHSFVSTSLAQLPVLTGISGCQYESAARTVDCPRPVTITLTGSGFLSGLEGKPYPSTFMKIEISLLTKIHTCVLPNTGNYTDANIVCSIPDPGFGKIASGVLMNVNFRNTITGNSTLLENAISFANQSPPRVDRVSGCAIISADGRSASQCDVVNDRITLHGSGFMSVDHMLSKLTLGSLVSSIYLFTNGKLIFQYNDSIIVFGFITSPTYLPAIEAHSGTLLALKLEDRDDASIWSTEPVYVSFVPLPDPIIRSITTIISGGCLIDTNPTAVRYRDCTSGMSVLHVSGQFLFGPVVVTLGGEPCRVTGTDASSVQVTMPIFDSVEDVFYDLTVTTPAGSITVPGLIEFNHNPLVYDIVPCIDNGQSKTMIWAHCLPGETLVVKMLNVHQTVAPQVWIRNPNNASMLLECPNAEVRDMRTVTCTTPAYDADWYPFSPVVIYLQWPDVSRTRTQPVRISPLWDPTDSPRINALSGCYSDSGNPLHANQCLGESNGVVLTLHGVNLDEPKAGPLAVQIVNKESFVLVAACVRPTVVNNETIICLLPQISETLGRMSYAVEYYVTLRGFVSSVTVYSNAGYITFVEEENHPSSSSTSASTIALATVFSIVGAVLITICWIFMCRSMRKQRGASELTQELESSSTSKHIELERV